MEAAEIHAHAENGKKQIWLIDGLVDLQVNGFRGVDMSDPRLDLPSAERFCHQLASFGVTRFLATLTTNSFEALERSLRNLDRLATQSRLFGTMLLGVHLEGPYISPENGPRGAHPRQYCRPPDLDEFQRLQDAAAGRIRILTLSPEFDSASGFIRSVSEQVVVSIGHTAATPDQISMAADQGASMSTHLGNGMHRELIRHPNYLWSQIADDRLHAGLIADGVHLDPAILKTIIRAKTPKRCFLVSDSTTLSGQKPGLYRNSVLGDVEITEDFRLVIAGQRQLQAGAYKPLIQDVEYLVQSGIVDWKTAIGMASTRPLNCLKIETGQPFADYVVIERQHSRLKTLMTVIDNRVVHSDFS